MIRICTKLLHVPCRRAKLFLESCAPHFRRPQLVRHAIPVGPKICHQLRQLFMPAVRVVPFGNGVLQLVAERVAFDAQVVALLLYIIDLGSQVLKDRASLLQQRLELRELGASLLKLWIFLTSWRRCVFEGRGCYRVHADLQSQRPAVPIEEYC